jgi:hypothetical protein
MSAARPGVGAGRSCFWAKASAPYAGATAGFVCCGSASGVSCPAPIHSNRRLSTRLLVSVGGTVACGPRIEPAPMR